MLWVSRLFRFIPMQRSKFRYFISRQTSCVPPPNLLELHYNVMHFANSILLSSFKERGSFGSKASRHQFRSIRSFTEGRSREEVPRRAQGPCGIRRKTKYNALDFKEDYLMKLKRYLILCVEWSISDCRHSGSSHHLRATRPRRISSFYLP